MNNSCVYLVGAGPGDPELLTVKAQRLIKDANVVVYDRLVSDEILDLIPIGTTKIYVGKATGQHSFPQDQINKLLVNLAKGHRRIVRLKGGDPFIFGRGSEEAIVLAKNHLQFEIVPGITSAMACASYAGIPLTHRGLANSVQFITGHSRSDLELEIEQGALSNNNCTLAIYMGLGNLEKIVNAVLDAGRPDSTPVAVIERGTTSQQRCVITTLLKIVTDVQEKGIEPPAMIIIGEVVNLAKALMWFETGFAQEPKQSIG